LAIQQTGEAATRRGQKRAVDIDRCHVTGQACHGQGEPAIARAEIDRHHAGDKAALGEHAAGIWPERLPPLRVRHFRACKETQRHRPAHVWCLLGESLPTGVA
jgi:hypothetical protein